MRKFFGYFLLSFFLLSCKPHPSELLVKKWKPVEAEGVNAEAKKNLLGEGNSMEFFKDGKFITFSPVSKDTGSYTLSEDGKSLHLYTFGNMETIFTVGELNADRLVLQHNGVMMVLQSEK